MVGCVGVLLGGSSVLLTVNFTLLSNKATGWVYFTRFKSFGPTRRMIHVRKGRYRSMILSMIRRKSPAFQSPSPHIREFVDLSICLASRGHGFSSLLAFCLLNHCVAHSCSIHNGPSRSSLANNTSCLDYLDAEDEVLPDTCPDSPGRDPFW